MENSTILCSKEDQTSFLVPSIGFRDRAAAHAYWESSTFPVENRLHRHKNAFAVVENDDRAYVPIVRAHTYAYRTCSMVWGASKNPTWQVLRAQDNPMPLLSYNTALLVEGPRLFERIHADGNGAPKWLNRVRSGFTDCYAVWGQADGSPLPHTVLKNGQLRVSAARSGRGVIFLEESMFDDDGLTTHTRVEVIYVDFQIFDKSPDKANQIKVSRFMWGSEINAPKWEKPDEGWKKLSHRARRGFKQHCQPFPADKVEWLARFQDQRKKLIQDELENRFVDRFTSSTSSSAVWEKALRHVEEPWQLAVVIRLFGSAAAFSDMEGGKVMLSKSVPQMIQRHACSEKRRKELRGMMWFAEAINEHWDKVSQAWSAVLI